MNSGYPNDISAGLHDFILRQGYGRGEYIFPIPIAFCFSNQIQNNIHKFIGKFETFWAVFVCDAQEWK